MPKVKFNKTPKIHSQALQKLHRELVAEIQINHDSKTNNPLPQSSFFPVFLLPLRFLLMPLYVEAVNTFSSSQAHQIL